MARVRRLLLELAGANLLTEHAAGRFSFHDLLRSYAIERADAVDAEDDRRMAVHRLLDHYLHGAHTAAVLREDDAYGQPPNRLATVRGAR